jgi:hypothetical protein
MNKAVVEAAAFSAHEPGETGKSLLFEAQHSQKAMFP